MGGNPEKEWDPRLGRCTECGSVYPVRDTERGWVPMGTDGVCDCGSTEFTILTRGS